MVGCALNAGGIGARAIMIKPQVSNREALIVTLNVGNLLL